MKKQLLIGMLAQFVALFSFAQSSVVSGTVVDAIDATPLIGTHVFLKSGGENWTTISDVDGVFEFQSVEAGSYMLEVSYIGYESYSKSVQVEGAPINLGILKMKEGVDLQSVQVVEQVLPVIQLGDTTQFNSSAYKTLPDADASDLIEKMPTVIIEDGKVQAQGEDVKKVLVDGKPFFGNDPTAALKNLPAEVVDKIQIYDEKSDQAQFTGFDDGETSKTINIITNKDMRAGQFGKAYAGYGYDDKYQAGGNVNIFNGDQRISVIGLSNNVNQQNFSTEDLLGVVGSSGGGGRGAGGRRGGGSRGQSGVSSNDFVVSQQGGITSSNAFGLNFSDKWGDKLDVSASYLFNQSNNVTEKNLFQQYFNSEGLTDTYDQESLSESTNLNHRFTGVFDYTINDKNSLMLRTNASWQGNVGQESVFGQTLFGVDTLNQTSSNFVADLTALNLQNTLLWRHKFEKTGRTFSINVSNKVAPQTGESYLLSDNLFDSNSSSLNQFSDLEVDNWNISANAQFTEPLNKSSQLMLNYKVTYQDEKSTKETFDLEEVSRSYSMFNEDLSNAFSSDYLSQSVGGGYRYRLGSWMMMARANVQHAELLTEQLLPYEASTENTFLNVLPMAMLSYRKSRSENVRVIYRTSSQLPSISQLQNVIDNSNPLQLSAGNPELLQGYQHSINGRYTKTNTEKSSVFFAMLSGIMTNDYIGTNTYFSAADFNAGLEEEAQISVPVNLDGYHNLRSLVTYGFPVTPIKSNLNIDLSGNYTRTPGLIDEELNFAKNSNAGLGLTLSSNISDRVDFTVSSRSNYNFVTNTLQTASNTNYLNQESRLKLNWILGDGIVFRTDLTHEYYDGLSDGFDQNYLLWNMSLGKKLFENDRGEISLSVFDLLNQNTALTRNVTEIYTEDVQTNVLQQYAMLSFKYDLRHFKFGE